MNAKEAVAFVKENEAQIIDIRFTDLFGMWHHFTIPAVDFSEEMFEDGLGFDGSSIRGFKSINESDMLLVPDPTTLFIDPFAEFTTAVVICHIEDPLTRERYARDPRFVAEKAEQYLRSTGIGDTAYLGPEAEFFLFDTMAYDTSPNGSWYKVDAEEAFWNSGNLEGAGHTLRQKGGYFPVAPCDKLQDVRSEMMMRMFDLGIHVEVHHHEVGSAGQCEIDMRFDTLVKMADNIQKYKYVVKNTAAEHGLIATFMPKPVYGDNGSGMHVHISLWKNGETQMYDEAGYAGLSDTARYFTGGILKHAASLLAFCAPTTNSYRRLVPGYEAPINLVYSQRNRSACVRIPITGNNPKAKRLEFRCPDSSGNPYLAFAAMLMAGIDGIKKKIEPLPPVDKDLYELPPDEAANIPQAPTSLAAVIDRLEQDHDYLTEGGVFTSDLIETYISYKRENEILPIQIRPHPYEFSLYYDV